MKKQKRKPVHLPLPSALGWIVGSALVVSVCAHLSFKSYFSHRYRQAHDPNYAICTIVQTGPQKEALKTDYLAEVIGISSDRPTNALKFDFKAAEQRLLRSPLISRAQLKLIEPNTLYIDYTVRQPVAWLYDYENIVIDKEGYPFPFTPFFSPKNLPEIYIGMASFGTAGDDPDRPIAHWGHPLEGRYVKLALNLLTLLTDPKLLDLFQVKRIDVSNAFAESYGTREIVVLTEDTIIEQREGEECHYIFPKILRLSSKNYAQELSNYLKLREQIVQQERKSTSLQGLTPIRAKEKIIDFRIANLAFIDEQKLP